MRNRNSALRLTKMRKTILLFVAILSITGIYGQLAVKNLLCENLSNPIGLDAKEPNFSWQLASDKRNTMQTAYEIRVGTDPLMLTASSRSGVTVLTKGKGILWTSGVVKSDASVYVPYKGAALASGKKYFWQVRVTDNFGNTSAWSEPASWQRGILTAADWKAKWIQADSKSDTVNGVPPILRKAFSTKKKIQSATAFITAHGMYEAQINGQRVGDAYLTPGWTSYNKRLQYQAFDVTNLVKTGANAVGVSLGSGWYRTPLAWSGNRNLYGKETALLFQLDITYSDGSTETVISDENWKSSTGAVRFSELYDGETYDAHEEKIGWTTPQYDDKNWAGVMVKDHSKDVLIGTYNELIKKHETFKPVKIFKTPKGEQVIDFGQNVVGWVQVKIKGNAGDKITISHAEVLDKAGNFYTENMRAAKTQNAFILRGGSEEILEPHFTFQGFRYIRIDDFKGAIQAENFTAIALYSDMKPTGQFSCSNPLLKQLQRNIEWGQRGNFLDVPTDCPQRDERLGWTGDAQAFCRTATFNMHAHNFYVKWMKDVAADQLPNGSVPFVIPNVLGKSSSGSTGWADVANIIPWNMYVAYGDKKILEDQYPSMKAWVKFMQDSSKNDLWARGFHFGDWLFYSVNDDRDGKSAITDKYLIAQCFYAYSTQLLINSAQILGKTDDVQYYTDLLKRIKTAFRNEYMTPTGRLVSTSQTAYVLALNFDMLPENLRDQAAERLVQNIKSFNNHLTTGFLGTPYLCHVLTRFGYNDVAYDLLLQETYPSWLYPVKMGATTIWERWDGIKPDGTFQTETMNSFNHYAYGAIGDWMYRVMTGIDTDEKGVGYKQITIKPHLNNRITQAASDYQTYYGKVSSHWQTGNDGLSLDVEIPANTTATIYVPAASENAISENGAALKNIQVVGTEGGYVVLKTGSGKYNFKVKK